MEFNWYKKMEIHNKNEVSKRDVCYYWRNSYSFLLIWHEETKLKFQVDNEISCYLQVT